MTKRKVIRCVDCGVGNPRPMSTCTATNDLHAYRPARDWRDDYGRRLPRGTVGRGWGYRT